METTDFQRIEKVKIFLGFKTDAEFQRTIGVKNSYMTGLRNNKADISKAVANSICTKYPQISFEWLLTGRGTMIRGNESAQIVQQTESGDNTNTGDVVVTKESIAIDTLVQTNAELVQTNKELSAQLVDYIRLLKERQ